MSYTKKEIMKHFEELGVRKNDTLLVHSSMKSIGDVENGAETVLDALIEYLQAGLLIFPTHTWAQMNEEHNIFDPISEPSCVGILSNVFMKRPGVLRSWHPTHSVAALGSEAEAFIHGEETCETPCPREGCWGKLYDRGAKIIFIGCSLRSNTIIHGVEEWNHIPVRLTEYYQALKIITPQGELIERPLRRHYHPLCDVSENYGKIEAPLVKNGIARLGRIGDAKTYICDARQMVDLVTGFLKKKPSLFEDNEPIPPEWYGDK